MTNLLDIKLFLVSEFFKVDVGKYGINRYREINDYNCFSASFAKMSSKSLYDPHIVFSMCKFWGEVELLRI